MQLGLETKRRDLETKRNQVHYTCNVLFKYEWKPPRCSSCKKFRHIHGDYLKNTSAGEKKTMKKPSQTSRGVLVVDNDVEFDINRGTTNLVNNGATSSGSFFMNANNDGEFASNTPISEKIDKIERKIGEGKLMLLDNDRNPLVPMGIVESDSEVEVVFDETANLRILMSNKDGSDKGYGTNSLLEQWRDFYSDNDDYDLYDDDMYENHDLSKNLQSICDDLHITVRLRNLKNKSVEKTNNKVSGSELKLDICDPLYKHPQDIGSQLITFKLEGTKNYKVCAPKIKKHAQLLRLMKFLIGLDDVFSSMRILILTTNLIHDVKFSFATLSMDESQ
nr:ribonuclease H-like domain-containing protein [Tanacetum cinerariifolium]